MSLELPVDDELTLQLLEPEHADEVFAVIDANREHLRPWLPRVGATRSAEDTRAFAQRALHRFAERKHLPMIVLEHNHVVGGVGWKVEEGLTASADIGYWLAADAQGRGIMTRSVRALIRDAFCDRGLNRLTIRCEPANERSGAIPRRLGFRHEGTMRRIARWDGRWIDHELFALLADEWMDEREAPRDAQA